MKKRIISLFCVFAVCVCCISGLLTVIGFAAESDESNALIERSDIPMKLWYETAAPITDTENSQYAHSQGGADEAWERWSLPIGNAYFGANVFGRCESERIQITEKTLSNPYSYNPNSGGLNNFSETYIDFNHKESDVTDYVRYLDLETAVSGVNYSYEGVNYTREYFASYPDKALVVKLSADNEGALSFTLRPTIPYEQDYMYDELDGKSKEGTVSSFVLDNGVGCIELAGKMGYYDIDFLGVYKVYTDGEVTASTTVNTYTDITGKVHNDEDGTIIVNGAKNAYIVVTLGTDYQLKTETFKGTVDKRPTMSTGLDYTRAKVEGEMSAIDAKFAEADDPDEAYNLLKNTHVSDYSELFSRVSVDFCCDESDFLIPTDELLEKYRAQGCGNYLETLIFQYGRYLLIASSRSGALPANLQGAWNTYNIAPWGSGYWHNINVQMNYWHAFSTNLAETFEAYVEYNNAYMKEAEAYATKYIKENHSDKLGLDGGNGWVIGTGQHQYNINGDRSAGNLGFTTQMFWDYYQFTKDNKILAHVYDVLVNAARYITKCVELDEDGNYLISYCDSPEVHVNGQWYYTKGTTYAQTFAYLNNYNALLAARDMGIDLTDEALLSDEEYSVLATVLEQVDKYDPIHVGLSGQIKEFREEDYYGSIGDEPDHRHISQLVGLYPGDVINSQTPAWLDAAKVTLENREGGNATGGWVYAHKSGLYARAKDGQMAHEMVNGLITNCAFPNLFTKLWNIFQIDASFGITAGITEMLLQSHEGYIEPLSAVPQAWANGTYTGLVARGNFEVSAKWENGVATIVNIKSNGGEIASVRYPTIEGACVVRASDGETVNYTVADEDVIEFNTEIGESYIISGFKPVNKPNAPTALDYSREGILGDFKIVWAPVSNAVRYNVSVAVENAPSYELVGSTKESSLTFAPAEGFENARMTFAVTAVSESGAESKRALCYYNPVTNLPVENDKLITKYGIIDENYESENDYPFAVFENGEFIGAYATWKEAMQVATDRVKGNGSKGKTVDILLRRNYDNTTAPYDTFTDAGGILNVDLGGHAINNSANLFHLVSNLTSGELVKETNIVIRNGKLLAKTHSVFSFVYLNRAELSAKVFNITLDNVDLGYASGATTNIPLFRTIDSGRQNGGGSVNFEFNDCDFDYVTNVPSGKVISVFNFYDPYNIVNVNAKIAGGSFIFNTLEKTGVKLNVLNEGTDTVTYMPNGNGAYAFLKLPTGASTASLSYSTPSGVRYFGKISADGTYDRYELISLKTVYGEIPASCLSAYDYPFAVFEKGEFIGAYATWKEAMQAAVNRVKGNGSKGRTVDILLRRNYDNTAAPYDTFTDAGGILNVDLGGHAINNSANLFHLVSNLTNGELVKETNIVISNGKLLAKTHSVFSFVYLNRAELSAKVFNITLNNVDLGYASGATTNIPLFRTIDSGRQNGGGSVNFEFNDCDFDYVTNAPSGKVISVFNFYDPYNIVNVNAKIAGGSLIFNTLEKTDVKLNVLNEGTDTVLYALGVYENYTRLVLGAGAAAPTDKFDIDCGTASYVKLYDDETNSVYILMPTAATEFVPKMSITLHGELTMNIYIPTAGLVKFTLDGADYENLSELDGATVVLDDGKSYYKLSVKLPAAEAARAIKLVATVAMGDGNATGTFTFSIPSYAKKVIESGEDVEKTLVKDVLAYIRSAYVYFKSADKDSVIKTIDEILGAYNREFVKVNGETNANSGILGVQLILNESPIIRFYLAEGKAKESYTFKCGGNVLGYKNYGTTEFMGVTCEYVDISLYAYQLIKEITYTSGADSGSYHINSYYDFVTTDETNKADANLISLVEKLYNYCKSAETYRASVTNS